MSINAQGAFGPVSHATSGLPVSLSPALPPIGQPYVYVLPTDDYQRIKIGRSRDPLDRIAGLVNIYPEIELARSVIIGVDSQSIEPVLHVIFGLRRWKLTPRRDGYTEWFRGDFADEVVDLCHTIADYRGCRYPVFHNVGALLQAYREVNPFAGMRLPRATRAEREASRLIVNQRLSKLAIEHARNFIEVLGERTFDRVIRQGETYFLVRNICRVAEPECWEAGNDSRGSAWSRRLLQAAQANIRVGSSVCLFRFLKAPSVELFNERQGREIYRICEGPSVADQPVDALLLPDQRAFRFFWRALSHLEIGGVSRSTLGVPSEG